MKYQLHTQHRQLLADTLTPVSIYLRIRDCYVNSILLESSDYHSSDNSFSYICCEPIARFELEGNEIFQRFPDGTETRRPLANQKDLMPQLHAFANSFEATEQPFSFITGGLFGYLAYDAVQHFEDLTLKARQANDVVIPKALYQVFRYVIAINHFKDELHIFEYSYTPETPSGIDDLLTLIQNRNLAQFDFEALGEESSNLSDEAMETIIQKCIDHCLRGDVFQIVPSRRFSRHFKGDEFNVYRMLRSINPSPYLFYFDFGGYKIFGSSPEKQIFIGNGKAEIHPIAGTFRRTGNDQADTQAAQLLKDDPKETAEHVMLVDLARNDLSRHCSEVTVLKYKQAEFYSHVIHLVSSVAGNMNADGYPLQLVADTFPAGTLSGAPKHNAMTIIDRYEPTNRGIYGGAIGFMSFSGNVFNHAIAIRTFISQNNVLYYQAGMGVVAKSIIASEMQEVHNKLAALRKAIELASFQPK